MISLPFELKAEKKKGTGTRTGRGSIRFRLRMATCRFDSLAPLLPPLASTSALPKTSTEWLGAVSGNHLLESLSLGTPLDGFDASVDRCDVENVFETQATQLG